MCLLVDESHFENPIPVMKCYKEFRYYESGASGFQIFEGVVDPRPPRNWATPHQRKFFSIHEVDGLFVPKYPYKGKAIKENTLIRGGFLHAYVNMPITGSWRTFHTRGPVEKIKKRGCYLFYAYAYNVKAIGLRNDLVCEYLYVPAFDKKAASRTDPMTWRF